MAENILRKLVNNSQMAIDDGVYEVDANFDKSNKDFIQIIKNSGHAPLLTEVKFSSPSLGKIRTVADPVSIASQMIAGGSKALSVLTQPHLFNGSPEYFMKVRQAVDVPMLMKDIMIDKVQIDAAKKIGADFMLVIQSLFDQNYLKEIDEFISYGHKQGLQILLEVHTKQEFENALKTEADLIGINNRNLDTLE
ncbi:MAG: indole-3-glycerol-phosphate synthase, partial [Nitrosopumilus sp.]